MTKKPELQFYGKIDPQYQAELTEFVAAKIGSVGFVIDTFDSTRRNFDHKSLDLKLVLRRSADDLTQDDVDKFMAAFAKQPQGNTPPEDNGKTVRAAFAADWIESFTARGEPTQATKPAYVHWAAMQIDRVYNKAREVPNE